MQENSLSIEQIKQEIKKLKLEIIEKEHKIEELMEIIESNEKTDLENE